MENKTHNSNQENPYEWDNLNPLLKIIIYIFTFFALWFGTGALGEWEADRLMEKYEKKYNNY